MTPLAVNADAQYQCSGIVQFHQILLETAELSSADRREVKRVECKDYIPTSELAQLSFPAILVRQYKIRCWFSDFYHLDQKIKKKFYYKRLFYNPKHHLNSSFIKAYNYFSFYIKYRNSKLPTFL